MYKLSEKCDYDKFDGLRDEMIRNRLVVGLHDKKVNGRLEMEDGLTLEKAIQVARQSENIRKQNIIFNESNVNQIRTPLFSNHSQDKFQKPSNNKYKFFQRNKNDNKSTQISTKCAVFISKTNVQQKNYLATDFP